jgi:SAM-dependent methyltransferase
MREPTSAYAEQIRAYYQGETARYGYGFRGLGYHRQASQIRRFEVLAEVGELDGKRILDVGAGLGDLLVTLWRLGVVADYTGLDLCEHLTVAAKARFRGDRRGPCRFVHGDVLDFAGDSGGYDYVLGSGIFGHKTEHTAARIGPTLERMFALCRRAVAVNFLSARAARQAPNSEYMHPAEVLEQAWGLTPAVTLRHDYLPHDFTLYLYREPAWRSAPNDSGSGHDDSGDSKRGR